MNEVITLEYDEKLLEWFEERVGMQVGHFNRIVKIVNVNPRPKDGIIEIEVRP
jgi:hypothetical protein